MSGCSILMRRRDGLTDGMSRDIDALTSSTLKHLRDRWWNADFTEFLRETLEPLPGQRILDVGCGVGTADVRLGQLGISQVKFFGIDLMVPRVREAVASARAHNLQVGFAAADVCKLPFKNHAFDSTFCVAVLQHVRDLSAAVEQFARVTKPGGRVLVVEPDNGARYWYSSSELGARAFELATRFFTALERSGSGDATDSAVGPKVSALFERHGIEPVEIRLFPVSLVRLGAPAPAVWKARHDIVRGSIDRVQEESLRQLGAEYLRVLDAYAEEAAAAGRRFVEIQSTMLFATIGQKPAAH
jgi:ubiquinone/menaquinone biosynthesis C-methylase UbiE